MPRAKTNDVARDIHARLEIDTEYDEPSPVMTWTTRARVGKFIIKVQAVLDQLDKNFGWHLSAFDADDELALSDIVESGKHVLLAGELLDAATMREFATTLLALVDRVEAQRGEVRSRMDKWRERYKALLGETVAL